MKEPWSEPWSENVQNASLFLMKKTWIRWWITQPRADLSRLGHLGPDPPDLLTYLRWPPVISRTPVERWTGGPWKKRSRIHPMHPMHPGFEINGIALTLSLRLYIRNINQSPKEGPLKRDRRRIGIQKLPSHWVLHCFSLSMLPLLWAYPQNKRKKGYLRFVRRYFIPNVIDISI